MGDHPLQNICADYHVTERHLQMVEVLITNRILCIVVVVWTSCRPQYRNALSEWHRHGFTGNIYHQINDNNVVGISSMVRFGELCEQYCRSLEAFWLTA